MIKQNLIGYFNKLKNKSDIFDLYFYKSIIVRINIGKEYVLSCLENEYERTEENMKRFANLYYPDSYYMKKLERISDLISLVESSDF